VAGGVLEEEPATEINRIARRARVIIRGDEYTAVAQFQAPILLRDAGSAVRIAGVGRPLGTIQRIVVEVVGKQGGVGDQAHVAGVVGERGPQVEGGTEAGRKEGVVV